jgi:hypothetical protein
MATGRTRLILTVLCDGLLAAVVVYLHLVI